MDLENWLREINQVFRDEGIEHRRRPFEAFLRYGTHFNETITFGSETAKKIFDWFEANSKPDSHHIGPLFESLFFFDSAFWTVSIPLIYGTVSVNALDCLIDMPESIKTDLSSDNEMLSRYCVYWADCLDYGLGFDEMRKNSNLNPDGKELLLAADQDLRSAIATLGQSRPDSRAILNLRLAVEIFFKSFIALKVVLTDKEARKIGHDLYAGLDRFIEVSGYHHLESCRPKLSVFPEFIGGRYKEQKVTSENLWTALVVAQSFGTLTVREHTSRNTIEQIFPR
jgi:hypothetical protein